MVAAFLAASHYVTTTSPSLSRKKNPERRTAVAYRLWELMEYVCFRVGKICNDDTRDQATTPITGARETVSVSSGWEVMECLVCLVMLCWLSRADLVNCNCVLYVPTSYISTWYQHCISSVSTSSKYGLISHHEPRQAPARPPAESFSIIQFTKHSLPGAKVSNKYGKDF